MQNRYYINLTSGIDRIFTYEEFLESRFVRIQSSHLEAKRFDLVLRGLSDDLLMHLALGWACILYDTSPGGDGESRAVWQGVPWINYALNRTWNLEAGRPRVRYWDCYTFFEGMYQSSRVQDSLSSIKYFRKFLNTEKVMLLGRSFRTGRDGDYEYFKKHLVELQKGE